MLHLCEVYPPCETHILALNKWDDLETPTIFMLRQQHIDKSKTVDFTTLPQDTSLE